MKKTTDDANFTGSQSVFNVDPELFQKGLVVISTDLTDLGQNNRHVRVSSHNLKFSDEHYRPQSKAYKKVSSLLKKLLTYSTTTCLPISSAASVSLYNPKRHGEIFIPISLPSGNGMYISPWTSQKYTDDFRGFDSFVSAGCMFGGALSAVFSNGSIRPLIDHQLPIPEHCIIEDISLATNSPFERVLFHDFKKNCEIIKALSNHERRPKLLFHMSSEGYILFGFKLFLQNKMSRHALNKLITIIQEHTHEYETRLREIGDEFGIELSTTSPFENIFSAVKGLITCEKLCLLFDLDSNTDFFSADAEKDATIKCLRLLQENGGNKTHNALWQKCKPVTLDVVSMEALFSIGNAIVIAQGSQDWSTQTCSLLPLSENQIQIKHHSLTKAGKSLFPPVVYITTLDWVIPNDSRGLLFYSRQSDELENLFATDLLSKASRNLGFFAQSTCAAQTLTVLPLKPEV